MSAAYYLLTFLFKITLAVKADLFNLETTTLNYGHIAECVLDLERNLNFNPTFLVISGRTTNNVVISENNIVASTMFRHGIPVVITDRPDDLHNTFSQNVVVLIYLENCENMPHFISNGFQDDWKYLFIVKNFTAACKTSADVLGHYALIHLAIVDGEDSLNQTLWSFLPVFNESICDLEPTARPALINSFTKGSWQNKEIFPPRTVRDYKKCQLNVGVANMFPYSETDEEPEDLKPINNAVGSDIELIKIVGEFHNFTPTLRHVFKHVEDPWLSTRFVTYLINGSLDVCVGGFYRIYGDQVDYSGIYNRQVVHWVYPIIREERHWSKFAKKLTTVYIFLLFYISYSLLWTYASRLENQTSSFRVSFVNGWGALMNSSGLSAARTNQQRILNYFYLYMCMHFSAFLSAKLYSFLTILAPGTTFQTNEDVMNSGKMPYLSNTSRTFVDDAKFIAFVANAIDCARIDCPLEILKHNGVTLVLSGFFPPFQTNTTVNYEATLMNTRDNLLTVYHEMLLRKDALFVDTFKDMILRLVESGITDRLYGIALGVTQVGKAETARKNALVNSYQCEEGCAITLHQIAGIFYVWAAGCSLSAIAFIVEMLYFINKNKK